jgi:exodeoxyribonuclease III
VNADIICLQEIKANLDQFDKSEIEDLGYHIYWNSALKKGYSGVAILTKQKPFEVLYGCGEQIFDDEGRVVTALFHDYAVQSVYMPSGSSGEQRQNFKFKWLDFYLPFAKNLIDKHTEVIISGDYNICHKEIDIHNPKANARSSGFLPEERQWMEDFIETGFIDTFRYFNSQPHHYTWWSFKSGARNKNLGWRIDYNMSSVNMKSRLQRSVILPDATHSDHCPVLLEFQ